MHTVLTAEVALLLPPVSRPSAEQQAALLNFRSTAKLYRQPLCAL